MKNWFKKKSKKDILENALLKWFEEKEDKRAMFVVLYDEDEHATTGALFGQGAKIISALVNEALQTEEIAEMLLESTKVYLADKNTPATEEKQPKTKRKKSIKVVS